MSRIFTRWALLLLLTAAISCWIAAPAYAGAVRDLPGFDTSILPANDDSSTGLVPISFDLNFLGTTYSQLYVNNNGNVTFDSALSTYTPFGLMSTSHAIIAPFFADVDTSGEGSGLVSYGNDTVNGNQAFGVEWPHVGYFGGHTDKLNTFELVLIDRSDTGAGNFDIEFNYDQIQWETGDASGGHSGLGGSSARAGFSNGSTYAYELPGSAVNGAFLDGGPDSLTGHSFNSETPGRYYFTVRNGTIDTGVPEPATWALMSAGLGALVVAIRRRR
jgi:hypothetical protein